MDRRRISEEVIEILSHKLSNLPLPGEDPDFDYDGQKLFGDITGNPLDISEVAMDLEDAFGLNFEDEQPGEGSLATVGGLIDHIHERLASRYGG